MFKFVGLNTLFPFESVVTEVDIPEGVVQQDAELLFVVVEICQDMTGQPVC